MSMWNGKIIARPDADGGYTLLVYLGNDMGWRMAGHVRAGQDVQEAIRNLRRPVLEASE